MSQNASSTDGAEINVKQTVTNILKLVTSLDAILEPLQKVSPKDRKTIGKYRALLKPFSEAPLLHALQNAQDIEALDKALYTNYTINGMEDFNPISVIYMIAHSKYGGGKIDRLGLILENIVASKASWFMARENWPANEFKKSFGNALVELGEKAPVFAECLEKISFADLELYRKSKVEAFNESQSKKIEAKDQVVADADASVDVAKSEGREINSLALEFLQHNHSLGNSLKDAQATMGRVIEINSDESLLENLVALSNEFEELKAKLTTVFQKAWDSHELAVKKDKKKMDSLTGKRDRALEAANSLRSESSVFENENGVMRRPKYCINDLSYVLEGLDKSIDDTLQQIDQSQYVLSGGLKNKQEP